MSRWGRPTKNKRRRDPRYFLNESVDFLPTLIVYNNGKVVYKAEAGIDLQLPEGYKINVTQTIDELIENKF